MVLVGRVEGIALRIIGDIVGLLGWVDSMGRIEGKRVGLIGEIDGFLDCEILVGTAVGAAAEIIGTGISLGCVDAGSFLVGVDD